MKLKTLCLAVALVSAAPSALAQEGPDPNGAVIVGEAPDCATGVIRSVIVGVGTLCADGTVGPGNAPGLLDGATVVGKDNTVDSYSTVFGRNNSNSKGDIGESGTFSTQVGRENSIDGILTNQFGNKNQSTGVNNHQFGHENITNGEGFSSQFGWSNEAFGTQNVQFGNHNSANGNHNTQAGKDNRVIDGFSNSMLGLGNELNGSQNHVHGNINTIEGQLNSVSGTQNSVSGSRNVVDGMDVQVLANRVVAGGVSVRATADDCVAFGSYSECDESDEFSVGGAAFQRRVVNMADGRDAGDAVNVRQVAPIADAFGGGAGFANGQFVAPNYVFLDGTTHNNVGSALDNLQSRTWALENAPGGGGVGPQGPQGDSAYRVAVNNGFAGSEQDWLASLRGADGQDGRDGRDGRDGLDGVDGRDGERGERGEKGGKGDRGEPGAPGTGDGVEGPQGPEGPAGRDGADGRDGIDGRDGFGGIDGRSAYEVAVANGFEGNEQDWLESLHGRDGRDGRDGSDVAAGRNIEIEDNEDGTRSVHLSDVVELSEEGRLAVGGTTVDARGVRIQGGPSMTQQGIDAGNQRITGVAAGRIERGSTDAVNGGQVWAIQQDMNDRWDQVNHRIDGFDARIDAVGAQAAAMAQMNGAGQYLPVGKVAVMGAWGQYGNKSAFALGMKVRSSERTSWSAGLSVAPDGKAMGGVGFAYTLP